MIPRQGFFDLGMDSLQANELRNRLQASLDCVLPPTLTFRFPTVAALTDHLAQLVCAEEEQPTPLAAADGPNEPVSEPAIDLAIGREVAQLEKLLAGH